MSRGQAAERLADILGNRTSALNAIMAGSRFRGSHGSTAPVIPESGVLGRLPASPSQVRGYQQLVDGSGAALASSPPRTRLPVDAATRSLAAHGGSPVYSDAEVNGIHLRMLAVAFGTGRALQFALPLTEVDGL